MSINAIALYTGQETTAEKVKFALKKLNISHDDLNSTDIKNGELKHYDLLIIPGGHTQTIFKKLDKEGFEQIKSFVKNGGSYIGISAGAFLASKKNPAEIGSGLGMIDIQCNLPNWKLANSKTIMINIRSKHPIVKNYSGKIKIVYGYGPMIKTGENVEILATYENNFAAIVYANYGKGKVIVFSPHPEGNFDEKIGTLNLLKNAISYALK